MPTTEIYTLNPITGEQELTSVEVTPDADNAMNGTADLVAGKATVPTIYAGNAVLLTRNQDNTTLIGNLYIYSPNTIPNVSFEIRSTNINDNGTVFWQIVE